LAHVNLANLLDLFFDRVLVPRAVHRELNKKNRFRYRLNKLYRSGFFIRCNTADPINVRLLRDELDEGESEALVQSQEQGAPFFIGDDRRARRKAELMGKKAVGTLRLLARLSLEGRAADLDKLVAILQRDLDFRVSDQVIQQAKLSAADPI